MKIIICGSRTFQDYGLLASTMDRLTINLKYRIVVISGHALGVDRLGEKWAWESGLDRIVFHPDYTTYGDKAPLVRNTEMVNEANALVAFWDGRSKGTQDVLAKARKKGLKIRIIRF